MGNEKFTDTPAGKVINSLFMGVVTGCVCAILIALTAKAVLTLLG